MRFFLEYALKNIISNKKRSTLFLLGLIIPITVITSLDLWSKSSENLLIKDYCSDVDFEIRIRQLFQTNMVEINSWMNNQSEILSSDIVYYNLIFFNAEEKDPFYAFTPFEKQLENEDPLSYASVIVPPKRALDRISKFLNITGDDNLQENEVLISKKQSEWMELVYKKPIEPGMKVNLSIARRSPGMGELYLFYCDLVHFYNVTIKGIYEVSPKSCMLKETFSDYILSNSAFFLKENLAESDIEKMDENGLVPIVLAKCKIDYLTDNGISGIAPAIYDLRNKITLKYPNLSPFCFVSSYERLLISYYQSTWLFVLFIPVIIGGYLQSIIVSDIILTERKKDILLLRDRGARIPQILSLLIIEFSILSIIAILISLGLSFLLASLIPLIASGTYSLSYYSFILSTMSFPTMGFLISSLGTIIVISLFVFIKNKQELNQFITERERLRRKKLLTIVLILVPIVIFTGLLIGILVLIIPYLKEISVIFNYNLEQIKTSSIILALLLTLFFVFIVLFTFGFSILLGKFKPIYKLIFPKNYFFLLHNFKKIGNRSSVLLILTILFSSSVFYSNLLVSSLNANESRTEYYNNGSDLRIETIDSRYQYSNNISRIEGVREAMPIFKLSGLFGYSSVTLYGVNPLRYSRLGRWEESSFNDQFIPDNLKHYNITQWMQRLESQKYGIFISDALAEKRGLEIGSYITIRNIDNPSIITDFKFIVVGIIHSAPGLGLASGKNYGLGQYNDEFVIIHENRMVVDFQLKVVNLFLANTEKNASINEISSEIYQFNNVSRINPKLISEGETTEYIQKYVPKIQLFINIEYTLMAILGLVLVFTFNNFILMNRRSTNAIFFAFGNSFKNFLKSLLAEYSIIIITTLIFSILFGFLLTTLILSINAPFLKSIIIIPLVLKPNVKGVILIPIIIVLVILISLLPMITSTKKAKLINYM